MVAILGKNDVFGDAFWKVGFRTFQYCWSYFYPGDWDRAGGGQCARPHLLWDHCVTYRQIISNFWIVVPTFVFAKVIFIWSTGNGSWRFFLLSIMIEIVKTNYEKVLEFYKAFSQSFSRNLLLTYNLRHRVRMILLTFVRLPGHLSFYQSDQVILCNQISNWCKWRHVVAKCLTNTSGTNKVLTPL